MSQLYPVLEDGKSQQRASRLRLMSGVCLTELMIGLAAGTIVLAATLGTFNTIHHHVIDRQRVLAYQQDLRLGLEVFEQEARLAGAETITAAMPDEFQFSANLNAQRTSTTGAVAPGQTVLTVQDGSDWGSGKRCSFAARSYAKRTTSLVRGSAISSFWLSRSGRCFQSAHRSKSETACAITPGAMNQERYGSCGWWTGARPP